LFISFFLNTEHFPVPDTKHSVLVCLTWSYLPRQIFSLKSTIQQHSVTHKIRVQQIASYLYEVLHI